MLIITNLLTVITEVGKTESNFTALSIIILCFILISIIVVRWRG